MAVARRGVPAERSAVRAGLLPAAARLPAATPVPVLTSCCPVASPSPTGLERSPRALPSPFQNAGCGADRFTLGADTVLPIPSLAT